jgi:hypothetical protein
MSKRINVNPDHYKTAGRERSGGGILHDRLRRVVAQERAEIERWQGAQKPQPPPPAPAPRKPAAGKKFASKTKPAIRPARKADRKSPRATTAKPRRRRPSSRPKRAS